MKAQRDESDGRTLLGDNTCRQAVMPRPITPQYAGVRISTGLPCIHIYSWPVYILLNSDLRKNRLAPYLPERNYCVNQGVSVGGATSQITGTFTFTADRTTVLHRAKDHAA
jgi:hypothetical protein